MRKVAFRTMRKLRQWKGCLRPSGPGSKYNAQKPHWAGHILLVTQKVTLFRVHPRPLGRALPWCLLVNGEPRWQMDSNHSQQSHTPCASWADVSRRSSPSHVPSDPGVSFSFSNQFLDPSIWEKLFSSMLFKKCNYLSMSSHRVAKLDSIIIFHCISVIISGASLFPGYGVQVRAVAQML